MARGSKPGERRGGRQKGTPNKRTQELYAKIEDGETPLDFLLRRMRDDKIDARVRLQCAIAAAPYCHARLASTEITGKDGKDLVPGMDMTDLDKARLIAHVLTAAGHGVETRH